MTLGDDLCTIYWFSGGFCSKARKVHHTKPKPHPQGILAICCVNLRFFAKSSNHRQLV
ncbi:predicted protein [Botrytis cinerea T4]|uniref:Uncharacterized protein n=1 Tax=Botryotinia fuckeliana (strain T4) TaxID=999810 RepID=G2YLZ2_BOTF4|nr:predicted protein [Botrytis cinerea T4]